MENEENTGKYLPLLQNEVPIRNGERGPESNEHVEEKADINDLEAVEGLAVDPGGGGDPGDLILRPRQRWSTGPFGDRSCCFGGEDKFFASDIQICLLGTFLPCVLHANNMKRLHPEDNYMYHCFVYSILSLVGQTICPMPFVVQWYAFPGRATLRQTYNLEGYGVNFAERLSDVRFLGPCCSRLIVSDVGRERCESCCDFALHCFCHECALCQEAREIHRRTTDDLDYQACDQSPLYYPTSVPSKQSME